MMIEKINSFGKGKGERYRQETWVTAIKRVQNEQEPSIDFIILINAIVYAVFVFKKRRTGYVDRYFEKACKEQ
ncbi:hypothetical protein [Domibacillus aminovorans]|uniref:Uncharacterized protein n=1 Tax=Domibacillus aminovorans TaxID=29332 RepID=A0A177L5I2_9BACI|nr:hypothetical protein [Domibacillus aminovorans]OAH60960.1 hypothetical protein AWH49_14375 [Domibacillus aminovorans]